MDCSTPGFRVLYYFPEFAEIHVHWVGDAIQPSYPLSLPFPPAFNLSQRQALSPGGTQMQMFFPQYQKPVREIQISVASSFLRFSPFENLPRYMFVYLYLHMLNTSVVIFFTRKMWFRVSTQKISDGPRPTQIISPAPLSCPWHQPQRFTRDSLNETTPALTPPCIPISLILCG